MTDDHHSHGILLLLPVRLRRRRSSLVATFILPAQKLEILTASNQVEIERAFATLSQRKFSVLIIAADLYFYSQMQRMATLAAQTTVPAIGPLREFAVDGVPRRVRARPEPISRTLSRQSPEPPFPAAGLQCCFFGRGLATLTRLRRSRRCPSHRKSLAGIIPGDGLREQQRNAACDPRRALESPR
jgi:hypothetical protein